MHSITRVWYRCSGCLRGRPPSIQACCTL